ncbi:MAG: tetratricopeptide repeat protein, partial [Planctomycetota bacterium]
MSNRLVYCVACICLCVSSGTLSAQESKSDSKALAIFADAAGYQNNGAFELAIEEWQKLLERYPNDPLASKASHYLGVSYIQTQAYTKAVQALQGALKDRKLDVREETLVNLGWCQFTLARSEQPESAAQKRGFAQAKQTLEAFSKDYPRSDFLDQSFFYLGEIEYTLGNPGKAIGFYRRLLEDRKYRKSPLRADAQYALAVAYEEQKDTRNALANFQAFLDEHPDHRLAGEVSVRQADLMLASGQTDEAVALLSKGAGQGELADYTLLRLGYAYSKQEEFANDGIAGSVHAPGGQLVQATDEWVGVREANILLPDRDGVRAPLAAYWLRQMGHKACVLEGGVEAAKGLNVPAADLSNGGETLPLQDAATLDIAAVQLVDLRASLAFRDGHIDGAFWSIRPRLPGLNLDVSRPIVLIGDEVTTSLAGQDLKQGGASDVSRLSGAPGDWEKAGLPIVTTPNTPSDADRIDHLFFTAERRHNK